MRDMLRRPGALRPWRCCTPYIMSDRGCFIAKADARLPMMQPTSTGTVSLETMDNVGA